MVKSNEVTIGTTQNHSVKTIELVYNIDSEVGMLKNLLVIIWIGIGDGLILSYFVGIFLASKTLIPIQKSWEKQSQFAADASHELRTPLAVIRTHLELLFRHPSNTIEQESLAIYKSLSEVDRISKLVEDLLTLARTDSNDQLINPSMFLLDELLTFIVQQFQPIAETKDISLSGNIDSNLMYYGDKERLHQLFVILLDNALKFTHSTGKVDIFCHKEGNSIKISIEDSGIGIPSEDLPRVFDRFYRSDKNRERKGGTGLGLSIAKWIVEVHDGTIKIDSKENEGTKVLIKLPIKDHY
jgi:signal transduction histidine kinase